MAVSTLVVVLCRLLLMRGDSAGRGVIVAAARCRTDMERLLEKYPPQRFLDGLSDGFYFDDNFRVRWPASYQSMADGGGNEAAAHFGPRPIVPSARVSTGPDEHPLSTFKRRDAYQPMTQHLLQDSAMYFKPEAFRQMPDERVAEAVAAKQAESAAAMAAGKK